MSHHDLPEGIRNGTETFYAVITSTNGNFDYGASPVIWESSIPEETTVAGAIKLKSDLERDFGTCYIARCQIITTKGQANALRRHRTRLAMVVAVFLPLFALRTVAAAAGGAAAKIRDDFRDRFAAIALAWRAK